ncbi:MAG: BrnT family toxin [Rubrobacter sp.]|nr:BrnT family toxin [Rubrobacter sp.]
MFDWDEDNIEHIVRHGVDTWEAEDAVWDPGRVPFPAHGGRAGVIGATEDGRILVVVMERGGGTTRVVTARDASKNEKRSYRRRKR